MSDDDPNSSTSTGAQHATYSRALFYVAPTDGGTYLNAIRIPLVPVACWRLNDPAFDFDSSFVAPTFRDELGTLSNVVAMNRGCPAALFGHCDPAGDDALNKTLGDRRAIAIYALLTRQPSLWEDLYSNTAVGDAWGTKTIQRMLSTISGRATDDQGNPASDPASNPYYAGAIDGDYGPGTTGAVKAFQTDSGNTADGRAGPVTRKALFGAYMDWLCTPPPPPTGSGSSGSDDSPEGTPFRMQLADFLGGAGAQPGDLPKMSLQSCGKFNPLVLLGAAEMNGPDQTARNVDDAPNRRVIMFFLAAGTTVDTGMWPCPKVKEPNDACMAAFWPDGEQRRSTGDALREYKTTRDTMACRFYDRFARRSPCEGGRRRLPFKMSVAVADDTPWTDEDTLVLLDSSGNVAFQQQLGSGTHVGPRREFRFAGSRPGETYRGEIRFGDRTFVLFAPSDIKAVQDAGSGDTALASASSLNGDDNREIA